MKKNKKDNIKEYEQLQSGPQRQKYWKELGPLEKVERMRSIVKQYNQYQQYELTILRNLVEQLLKHKHLNNDIVIDLKISNTKLGVIEGGAKRLGEKDNDEIYF